MKRTVSGFLSQVGAEEAMTSDQVVWSEQGRLHLTYTATANSSIGQVVTITYHIDGVSQGEVTIGDGSTTNSKQLYEVYSFLNQSYIATYTVVE